MTLHLVHVIKYFIILDNNQLYFNTTEFLCKNERRILNLSYAWHRQKSLLFNFLYYFDLKFHVMGHDMHHLHYSRKICDWVTSEEFRSFWFFCVMIYTCPVCSLPHVSFFFLFLSLFPMSHNYFEGDTKFIIVGWLIIAFLLTIVTTKS